MRYKKSLVIVVMKKERIWRKRRKSRRKNKKTNINHLMRHKQPDQGEKQQVGGLIDSIQL